MELKQKIERGYELRECKNPLCDKKFKVKKKHRYPLYCEECSSKSARGKIYRDMITLRNKGILERFNLKSLKVIRTSKMNCGYGFRPKFETLYLGHSQEGLENSKDKVIKYLENMKKVINKDLNLLNK